MPKPTEDDAPVRDWLRSLDERHRRLGGPGGGANYGATPGLGGPMFADRFGSMRSPSPRDLLETYKSILYAAVNLKANAVVKVPLRLYVSTGRGDNRPRCECTGVHKAARARLRELSYLPARVRAAQTIDEVTDHPLLDLLAKPNPYYNRAMFLQYVSQALDIMGTAYLEPVLGGLAKFQQLWPLPAYLVRPIPGSGDELLAGYVYLGERYLPEELIRFRVLSQRDPYLGQYGPAHAAFQYQDLHDKYLSVAEAVLGNGPAPGFLLRPKDPNASVPESAAAIEARFEQKFARGGRGRALFIDGALDADPITYPPSDLAGMTISEDIVDRICNCLEVPPGMFKAKDVNRANLDAAHRQLAERAVEPRCLSIANVLTEELAQKIDPRLFFAFDSAVPGDVDQDIKKTESDLKTGVRVINEIRAERGDDDVEWGDEPWLASSLRQPSEERPEPAALQPKPEKPAADDEVPHPGDEEETDEGGKKPKDDDEEKALLAVVTRLAERVEQQLNARSAPAPARNGSCNGVHRADDSAERSARRAERKRARKKRRREHVRIAGREADQAAADAVLPAPVSVGAGDDPDDRPAAAGDSTVAGAMDGANDNGDDALDLSLLGRQRAGDAGEAGAGPERMEGDESALEGTD